VPGPQNWASPHRKVAWLWSQGRNRHPWGQCRQLTQLQNVRASADKGTCWNLEVRRGHSGGTSQGWAQGWSNCSQDWTVEVDRGSHGLRGPLIGGPRAGPSGGTSQWWAQDWGNCCQDRDLEVSRGPYCLQDTPNVGPRAGHRGETSLGWAQDEMN